ncbi:MAG: copper oxidase, partial [Deltaproteobacteria bacterium]|nr:copper oxidase [Deltaproteobacteria bacterium]
MITRRQMLVSAMAALTGGMILKKADAASNNKQSHAHEMPSKKLSQHAKHSRVVTPNGSSLPYKMKNGVKEFHLIAEAVER